MVSVETIASKVIKLTSGLKVQMRKLTLADESVLSRSRASDRRKQEKVLRQIMDRCTLSVSDPGPYSFIKDGAKNVPWKKILSGDTIDAMLQLRMFSYTDGNELVVPEVKCSSCRERFSWRVDLPKDLRRQPLSKESFDNFKKDVPFSVDVAGHTVEFILATGDTEGKYRELANRYRERDMACGLRSRIVSVKPVGSDEKIKSSDIMDWLDGNDGKSKTYPGLLSDDAEILRDEMDRVDAGIDLEVKATCPAIDCGETVWFDLPFDNIFLPGKGIQERKMIRRQGSTFSEE